MQCDLETLRVLLLTLELETTLVLRIKEGSVTLYVSEE